MKKSCFDCKKQPQCKRLKRCTFKGRELGYVTCSDGDWPITMTDKIRAMTDDEIVDLFFNQETISLVYDIARFQISRDQVRAKLMQEVKA